MDNKPWVSASVRFTLKNAPKEQTGLSGEHWNFGKDDPITLSHLLGTYIVHALEFYLKTVDISAEEAGAQLNKVRELLAAFELVSSDE